MIFSIQRFINCSKLKKNVSITSVIVKVQSYLL